MVEALVNPSILAWARERAGFAVSEIAKKLDLKQEKVEAWEKGDKKPTFRQAQRFADKTYIPFGYLFLNEPPKEELPIPDLRTIGDHPIGEFSLALKDTIRGSFERLEWYKDFCREQEIPRVNWIGSTSINEFKSAVTNLNNLLSNAIGQRPREFHNYYAELRKEIEDLGVLVMRNSVVESNTHRPLNRDEFRGFAISDDYAPVIFINAADTPQAQIFTLMHEFVHLLINESGVSDLSHRNENKIEKFCNRVAAEFLVPTNEFTQLWNNNLDDWKHNLPELASHFHVSHWVIARRALETGFISEQQYWEHYSKILAALKKDKEKQKEKDGGPTYYRMVNTRYSKRLANAVASEALSGRMLLRDAQRFIGIHPSKLKSFAKKELSF